MSSQIQEKRLCGRREYYQPLVAFLLSKGALNYGLQEDLRITEYTAMNRCSQNCGKRCMASLYFEYEPDPSPHTRHPEVPLIADDRVIEEL